MRRKNETGMTLVPEEKPAGAAAAAAAELLPAAAVLLGVYGTLCAGWGWQAEDGAWFGACAGVLSLALFVWLLRRSGRNARWLSAAALAAAGFCVIFAPQVQSAAARLLNDCLAFLETQTGRIYLRHAQKQAAGVSWALVPGGVLLGALVAAAAVYAPYAGAILAAAAWAACLTGAVGSSAWLLVLAFGGVWMLLTRHDARGRALFESTLTAGVLLAAAGLALGLSGAADGVEPGALHDAAAGAVHRLLYEPAAQTMPEGDFTRAGTIEFSDQPMLRVTMSEPESLYLRGYIGQTYTQDGWEPEEPEALAPYAQTFYWLHQTPFYAQSQLSALADALGEQTRTIDMTVTSVGACRENLYAPYELTASGSIPDPMRSGDGAQRLNGRKSAAFRSDENLVGQAYALLAALQEKLDDAALADYLEAEGNYRAYVYETDLSIPEQTAKTLESFLGTPPERITSYEAKQRILTCLDETVQYAQSTAQLPEGADFTSYFLKELGEGNAVHYATAAVMMLRYFGIPARYAEGYLIMPDAVAGQSGEITLTLRGTDAHAWAEYYEDGVGWIPFEVTPPYRGVMAESDWLWYEQDSEAAAESSESQQGQLGGAGQSLRPQAKVEKPEQTQREQQESGSTRQETMRRLRMSIWIWLGLLALALLAAIVIVILRRRAQLKKREQAFSQPDHDRAAAALFAHSLRMMWASGMPRENRPVSAMDADAGAWGAEPAQFAQICQLHACACYSSRTLTPEQREQVFRFEQQTRAQFIGKLKWYQKLYQKWIRCMY